MHQVFLACVTALTGCGTSAPAPPPSFFALGGDVYHAKDRLEAERQMLKFDGETRWFNGFPREVTPEEYDAWEKQQGKVSRPEPAQGPPVHQIPTKPAYPRTIAALPLQDQGATLQMTPEREQADAVEIVLTLTLAAGERAIQREIEHRRTNVLPFLFAFTADGKPVSRESRGGIQGGGANQFIELVPAKSRKSWKVRVAIDSLAGILPADAKETAIVAVFSERQHEYHEEGGPMSLEEVWSSDALKKRPPQIVLRSNEVRLRKAGTRWLAEP